MNASWVDVNTCYAIFDVSHHKFFKGYYDDGWLYEETWCDNAIEGTLFNTTAKALEALDVLKEDEPGLHICVAEVKITSEISVIFNK